MSTTTQPRSSDDRLFSLDAYRGLIMITLAFGGFGLAGTAGKQLAADPGSSLWETVRYQFSHAQWIGCSYWDLIQPSFMFMVGVSMALSMASCTIPTSPIERPSSGEYILAMPFSLR